MQALLGPAGYDGGGSQNWEIELLEMCVSLTIVFVRSLSKHAPGVATAGSLVVGP